MVTERDSYDPNRKKHLHKKALALGAAVLFATTASGSESASSIPSDKLEHSSIPGYDEQEPENSTPEQESSESEAFYQNLELLLPQEGEQWSAEMFSGCTPEMANELDGIHDQATLLEECHKDKGEVTITGSFNTQDIGMPSSTGGQEIFTADITTPEGVTLSSVTAAGFRVIMGETDQGNTYAYLSDFEPEGFNPEEEPKEDGELEEEAKFIESAKYVSMEHRDEVMEQFIHGNLNSEEWVTMEMQG